MNTVLTVDHLPRNAVLFPLGGTHDAFPFSFFHLFLFFYTFICERTYFRYFASVTLFRPSSVRLPPTEAAL